MAETKEASAPPAESAERTGTPGTHGAQTPAASTAPYTSPFPVTSSGDNGQTRRPRDARLIHMILAALGISSYQERVPLQLLDFAYRYTSSTLQDALHLTAEGYGQPPGATGPGKGTGAADGGSISLPALRLSIASRLNYQFASQLPKEFLLEQAQERNRVALPAVGRDWGVRLPPERYCLTGVGWGLKEEWATEEAEEEQQVMKKEEEGEEEAEEDDDEKGGDDEDDAKMEDVFGGEQGDTKGSEDETMNGT